METKVCTKCQRELPLSQFGRKMTGRLRARCFRCDQPYRPKPPRIEGYYRKSHYLIPFWELHRFARRIEAIWEEHWERLMEDRMRRCPSCGRDLPWSAYYLRDGRPRETCKTCMNAAKRKRYREDPDYRQRALERRRRQKPA